MLGQYILYCIVWRHFLLDTIRCFSFSLSFSLSIKFLEYTSFLKPFLSFIVISDFYCIMLTIFRWFYSHYQNIWNIFCWSILGLSCVTIKSLILHSMFFLVFINLLYPRGEVEAEGVTIFSRGFPPMKK